MVPNPFSYLFSRNGCGLFDRKNPDASRNCDQAMAVQARHVKIKLVPCELGIAPHQRLKVAFRGGSEKFEDAFSDGLWSRHQASFLHGMN